MATYIDGICASQNVDSSGEVVDIAGLDISSLAVDGCLNWEHMKDNPMQIVGKILKAKKIFSDQDCEDERQKYFWQLCQMPFVYILGELFDDYTDSARHVAGLFRYDHDKRGTNERNVLGFSVEGAKLPGAKDGMTITRSIARKCTITNLPCNKMAIAEMVPANEKQPKDDFDSLFKTEPGIEIELFKMESSMVPLKKDLPATADVNGSELGKTKTGKPVTSHGKIGEYQGFSSADHKDAMSLHLKAAQGASDSKIGRHHLDKMKLHMQASDSAAKRENRATKSPPMKPAPGPQDLKAGLYVNKPNKSTMAKALTAGSGMAAPGELTGGAALQKEDLLANPVAPNRMKRAADYKKRGDKVGHKIAVEGAKESHKEKLTAIKAQPKPKLTKSDSLLRAEEEYAKWEKKEQFRDFMKTKVPNLAVGEIDAIGQTIVLKKALEAESALASLAGIKKSQK